MSTTSSEQRQRKGEGDGGIIVDVEPMIVLATVQSLQWQAQIAVRDSLTRLKIHPTHRSKHATIRAMRLVGLHLKNH